MEELKCKNCGAPLARDGHCEYCGAQYRIDRNLPELHYVEVHAPMTQTIGAEVIIDRWMRGRFTPERISEYATEELSKRLASGLTEYLKLNVREDPLAEATIIRGTVRVIPPDFRL